MSSTSTFASRRSKLMAAASRLGNQNGHAMPPEGSNADKVMHEYLVATDLSSFCTKRRSEAKIALGDIMDHLVLDNAIAEVVASGLGVSGIGLADSALYKLQADIKKPTTSLNKTKLRNELVKAGWSSQDIDDLIEDASDVRAPAVTLKVVAA